MATMPASTEPYPHLPAPLTPLIGREREVAAVIALLQMHATRLVTLTGPGGVGKTRLALAAAGRLGPTFANDVVFVGLAPIADPGLVLPTIARVLGVRDGSDEPLTDRLTVFIGARRLLLVLDNLEQVVEAAPLITDLLSSCPALKVLATSRVRLRLSGEREFGVPPLRIEGDDDVDKGDPVLCAEAVRLFVERAQAVRPEFALKPELAPVVSAICQRLDGLPLAIELAAARTKVLPPVALLDRLEQRLPILTGGGRDLPERQQTMANTIAWSYELLSPPEQCLFRRLGVFVGGFDLAAAAAVSTPDDDQDTGVLEGVASLVEQSLLRQSEGVGDEPRFTMLETVREYAVNQLAAHGEEAPTRTAHANYFLALAERLIPEFPGAAIIPSFRALEAEHPNLRAALEWLAAATDQTPFLRLATRLWQFWYLRGYLSEGRRWLEQAVAAAEGAPPVLHAKALHGAGQFAHYQGDDERAVPLLREALKRSRHLGRSWVTANILLVLGVIAEDQGAYEEAEAPLRESLALWRELGGQSHAALTTCHLGIVAYGRGDRNRADELLVEALRSARVSNDPFPISTTLHYLALFACERGDMAGAAAYAAEQLVIEEAYGEPEGIAHSLACAGVLGVTSGKFEVAAQVLAAAEALRREIGVMVGLPERATYERAADAASAALGEEQFTAAWAAGKALSRDQAIATAHALATAAAAAPAVTTIPTPPHGLTPRELDVLRLVAAGYSNREIAEALFISIPTVKRHVTNILGKLALPSRSALNTYAHTHGLV